MADDIRCPMCSKSNPAGSTACQYCGARLKPLGSSPEAPGSADTPDWLRDIRTTPGDPGPALPWETTAASEEAAVPDWLSEVRGLSPSAPPPAAEDGSADPLSRFSAAAFEDPAPASEESGLGLDDWFSSLRDPNEAAPPPAPASPAAAEEDWTFHLQTWNLPQDSPAAAEQPAESAAAAEELDLSAWLKNLDGESSPGVFSEETSQPEPGFQWQDQSARDTVKQETGVTDWLTQMAYQAPEKQETTPEEDSKFQDWMSSEELIRSDDTSAPDLNSSAAEPAAPDWLAGSLDSEPAAPAAAAGSADGLPDWLAALAGDAGDEPAADLSLPAADDAMPAWLGQAAPIEPVGQAPAAPLETAAVPDWLAGFEDQQPTPDQQPAALEVPAWITDSSAVPEPPADVPPLIQEDGSENEYFTLFGKDSSPEPKVEQTQPVHLTVQPEPPAAAPPEPDWLAAFGEAAGASASDPPASSSTALPFIDPQQPAWLENVAPPAGAGTGAAAAFLEEPVQAGSQLDMGAPFKVDLPDWLDSAHPSEGSGPGEETPEFDTLAQAELPNWVQDMRPIESAIPGREVAKSADQQREEKSGPLAGMRGILPAEEAAVHFRKLPAYSAKLRVSERQRAHASLFQDVLTVEAQPFAVPLEPSQAPQRVYRLLIGVVLILALFVGLVLKDMALFPAPVLSSADQSLLDLYNAVEALPANAPVLLAVDYEAALSGEMRIAASAVMDHLMARKARIVIVSTVPAGPVLADDLLAAAQPGQPNYDLSASMVNLGYLAGGPTSLLEFAQRPSVAAPLDADGVAVWDQPILAGVEKIQDFRLVIVLTDTVETGRAWVEQVQPMLGDVPLTMVASAQAGPLLQPYYKAGQVKGLLSGLLGGALYEQRAGKQGLANKDWNAYQLGYAVGILMLILGGVISAVMGMTRKTRKGKG